MSRKVCWNTIYGGEDGKCIGDKCELYSTHHKKCGMSVIVVSLDDISKTLSVLLDVLAGVKK